MVRFYYVLLVSSGGTVVARVQVSFPGSTPGCSTFARRPATLTFPGAASELRVGHRPWSGNDTGHRLAGVQISFLVVREIVHHLSSVTCLADLAHHHENVISPSHGHLVQRILASPRHHLLNEIRRRDVRAGLWTENPAGKDARRKDDLGHP